MAKVKQVQYDDAVMVKDPDRWPCWPFLPIKRGPAHGYGIQEKTLGILVADEQLVNFGKPTVYFCYLFDLPKSFKDVPKQEYESVEALLADGWIVD